MFLEHDNKQANSNKEKYFARCFINETERESNDNGLTRLLIDFNAAWGMGVCLIDGYPQESEDKCPTLETVCKELKVVRLIAKSEEPGMYFEESISYDRESGICYESQDLYLDPVLDTLESDERLIEEAEM